MRILFFGIYKIGRDSLVALCNNGWHPVAVVTKPDIDEGQPVAIAAEALGLRVLKPRSPKEPDFEKVVTELRPDLCLVAGYHKIIPATILKIPKHGTLNLHGSLLPAYRGPCTWKWAIVNGEKETGVTVHYMEPTLDSGDIVSQAVVPIRVDDTGGSLFSRLSSVGAGLLTNVVGDLVAGKVVRIPQDESLATYYGYPTEADCRICWSDPTRRILDQVRGFNPSPGAWSSCRGKRIRIWEGQMVRIQQLTGKPGTVLSGDQPFVLVETGDGVLKVVSATCDGETSSKVSQFRNDLRAVPGEILGV